jgi:hypothetical protein
MVRVAFVLGSTAARRLALATSGLEFHVLVASDPGQLDTVRAERLLEEVRRISRVLHALSKRLRQRQ